MFEAENKVHLIGIGGIGMSGIAQLLLAQGLKVSGSDLKDSQLIEKLRSLGIKVYIGHSASNVKGADKVVYTPAVSQDNPELQAARSLTGAVLTRAQALAELANQKKTIAVTGAHGKTTTSSLISHMLAKCGLNPTVCVGGELFSLNGNALLGQGGYFVLEADESDGSLVTLNPFYSVVTNIDREHLDYYRNLDHIKETFRQFMENTQDEGMLFCCQDDAELIKIANSLQKNLLTFGLSGDSDITAFNIKMQERLSQFDCIYQRKTLGRIHLETPGEHNISNSLAAVAVGLKLGIDFSSIQGALASYEGVRRRMELKLREKDILIFEDYAHHPTEIKATIKALKNFPHKRIIVAFQPHRYTRTKSLIDDFGRCFKDVDYLIITDIYAASEAPIAGVSAETICQKAHEAGVKRVEFMPKQNILKHLFDEIGHGDLVAILGAGDIGGIAGELAEKIKSSS